MHYRDEHGLECDAIVILPDGSYGLVEIKLGGKQEDSAEKNLNKLEKFNNSKKSKPRFKMILTAGNFNYTKEAAYTLYLSLAYEIR